jgi:hypothetical protein
MLRTSRQDAPEPFHPPVPPFAAGTLGYFSVQYYRPYRLLSRVVRRRYLFIYKRNI